MVRHNQEHIQAPRETPLSERRALRPNMPGSCPSQDQSPYIELTLPTCEQEGTQRLGVYRLDSSEAVSGLAIAFVMKRY